MKRIGAVRLSALVLLLALAIGCAPGGENPAITPPNGETDELARIINVQMNALNDSGQQGSATLTSLANGKTRVVLDLTGSPAGPQPTHIHKGTCDNLNPQPEYPLTNTASGKSETEVAVSLDDLLAQDFAINVHKSPEEVAIYTSCGDIKA